jgi:hypothetical protein
MEYTIKLPDFSVQQKNESTPVWKIKRLLLPEGPQLLFKME